MTDFEQAFQKTIIFEGGDSNDPDDNGGLTRYGISQKAYPDLDIKALTLEGAKELYRRDYWDRAGCDRMGSQLHAEMVFDMAVNMGVAAANKVLWSAPHNLDHGAALMTLKRIARYAAICNKNPKQKKFLLGWINRSLNLLGMR